MIIMITITMTAEGRAQAGVRRGAAAGPQVWRPLGRVAGAQGKRRPNKDRDFSKGRDFPKNIFPLLEVETL